MESAKNLVMAAAHLAHSHIQFSLRYGPRCQMNYEGERGHPLDKMKEDLCFVPLRTLTLSRVQGKLVHALLPFKKQSWSKPIPHSPQHSKLPYPQQGPGKAHPCAAAAPWPTAATWCGLPPHTSQAGLVSGMHSHQQSLHFQQKHA
eukprot:219140-Pelagomonas_calceolata.AAC.9